MGTGYPCFVIFITLVFFYFPLYSPSFISSISPVSISLILQFFPSFQKLRIQKILQFIESILAQLSNIEINEGIKTKIMNSIQILQQMSQLQLKQHQHLDLNLNYKFQESTFSRYISARCCSCKSSINYIKCERDQVFKLSKASLMHKHTEQFRKPRLNQIATKISQLRAFDSCFHRDFIQKKFLCSLSTYYRAKKLAEGGSEKHLSFKGLAEKLQSQICIYHYPFDMIQITDYPEVLNIISPLMNDMYNKCGQCVYLFSTFNLINNHPNFKQDQAILQFNQQNPVEMHKKQRQFLITTICGLNSFRKIVCFGFAVTLSQNKQTTERVLKTFFDSKTEMITKCIITDGGRGIQSGIKALNQSRAIKIEHLLDAYHVLKNVKIKGANKRTLLSQLYHSQTIFQYQQSLNFLEQLIDGQEKSQMDKVDFLSNRFCLAKVPNIFIHGGSSSSPCQKLNDMMKGRIKYADNYCNVVLRLITLLDQINSKYYKSSIQNYPFQKVLDFPILKQCRQLLCKKVFLLLLNQLQPSSKYYISFDNSTSLPYYQVYTKINAKFESHYVQKISDDCYSCICGKIQKSRLLCDHSLAVIVKQETSIYKFIPTCKKQDSQMLFLEIHNSGIKGEGVKLEKIKVDFQRNKQYLESFTSFLC